MTFKFPRALLAIENIQRDVIQEVGRHDFGDYSAYAHKVENLFLPASLAALDEKGIPLQVAYKLKGVVNEEWNLDQTLTYIKGLDLNRIQLEIFERELFEEAKKYF